jgi:hypothetical protein
MNAKNLRNLMLLILSAIFRIGAVGGGLMFLSSVTGIQGNFYNYSVNRASAFEAAIIPTMIAVQIAVCAFGIVVVRKARKTQVQATETEMSHSVI